MSKNRLMLYTFVALVLLVGVSVISWWPTSVIIAVIAVTLAVALDFGMAKILKAKGPVNTMSAAVFGLIVALSYTLGVPNSKVNDVIALTAPNAYYYVIAITIIGMVVLKKAQTLMGRKYVNPAAAAKLLVLFPFLNTVLLAKDHFTSSFGGFGIPSLASPIGYGTSTTFAGYVQSCMANNSITNSQLEVFYTLFVQKSHGWAGGASSLAVILVGLGFFIVCRGYIKWRITATYLGTTALMSVFMFLAYGGDLGLRLMFELFIGSSIFMAFFMATDPATTPLTYRGQIIFGAGLAVITVLVQTYMNFFGGSILALVIMNLLTPLLDRIGQRKPTKESVVVKLPKPKEQTTSVTACIRCGKCLVSCAHNLNPILIKEAFDRNDVEKLRKLRLDYCNGCGYCNYVCPSRIDLQVSRVSRTFYGFHIREKQRKQ
jgi:electron transport complex protein RnfD